MKSLSRDAYTVAMICPLEVEMSAARYMLDEEHSLAPETHPDWNQYILGQLSGHNVVIASLPLGSQGTVSAATVAMNLVRSFVNIKLRLLVGIAGGVPSSLNDIRLGDVVVSTPSGTFGGVVEYDLGKQTSTGFVRKGFLSPPPAEWRGAIAKMKSDHRVRSNKVNEFLAGMLRRYPQLTAYGRPLSDEDFLFTSDYQHEVTGSSCANCDHLNIVHRSKREHPHEPVVFYGLIASGNSVIKHAAERDRISTDCDGVLCFEMEAAGVMNDFPCIVVRGISDYCDSHKNDSWHLYAAAAAAGIAKELLEYLAPNNVPRIRSNAAAPCLQHLFVTDPDKDKQRIESDRDDIMRECYSWVLSDPKFTTWRDAENEQLLFIKGGPGKGKTMLMIGLVHEITTWLKKQPEKGLLTYFFCQSSSMTLNNAVSILRGLIWMIVCQDQSLIRYVQAEYDKFGDRLFEGPNAFFTLRSIFLDILEDPGMSAVYILIDAIDECSVSLDKFLHPIVQGDSITRSTAKWILTSRHRLDISRCLENLSFHTSIDLEETPGLVTEAVSTFISHKTHILSEQKFYDSEVKKNVEQALYKKAGDTFLWVALVCRELASAESWEAESIIGELPSGLEPLYEHMLSQIKNLRKSQSDVCYEIIRSMTLAFRPVYLEELPTIASLPSRLTSNLAGMRSIVEMCGSFLAIRENRISFVHQSAKDYLTIGSGQKIFDTDQAEGHCKISVQLIRAMSGILKRNLADMKHPGIIKSTPTNHQLNAVAYAVCYWIHHLLAWKRGSNVPSGPHDISELVHKFLQTHVLHWIEALGLLRKVSEGLLMIYRLMQYLKEYENGNLFYMVHDMNRLILQSRSIIEQAPLQIYCSALIFAPMGSIIRNQFKHYIPDWIRTLPKAQEDWNPLLQTMEGHSDWANDIAFSANGDMAASASNDHTIRLWDTVTGSTKALLQGHTGPVKAVCYCPSGHLLASGSNDCTVRLWNPNTGAECGILRGHTALVNAVAFDSRGKFLASVSNDKSVRIWDTEELSCRHILLGHKNWVNDVAYSPDGTTLVTVAGDATIRLWNLSSLELECRLRGVMGGMGWLNAVSVSQKNRLAAGSANGNIYLWDMTKKTQIGIFHGHTSGINRVVFSHEEDILVSGSNDCTVRLWNTLQCHAIATLESHTGAVMGVAVSPRDNLIVSVSMDGTLRLWDSVNKSISSRSLQRHMRAVTAVAVSPDGHWGASISRNNTGLIWNLLTELPVTVLSRESFPRSPNISWSPNIAFDLEGKRLAVTWADPTVYHWELLDESLWSPTESEEGTLFPVLDAFISPNNQFLASQSTDMVVRTWDIASGQTLSTFSHEYQAVKAFCFSPCSQYLATASVNGSIYLWEVLSGNMQATLAGHEGTVNSVKFSSDGQLLLSGSADRTVRLWNVAERKAKKIMKGHAVWIETVGFFENDTLVFSISGQGMIMIWHIADGTFQSEILEPDRSRVFLSPTGKFVGWLNQRENVFHFRRRLREDNKGRFFHAIQSVMELSTSFVSIIFSRDDRLVAMAQSDGLIQILNTVSPQQCCVIVMSRWKMAKGIPKRVPLPRRPERPPMTIEFSPNGDRLACVSQDSIYIWDPVTGNHHTTLTHYGTVNSISFSSDGNLIASTSSDGAIRLWELRTGILRSTIVTNGTRSTAFFGNGMFGATPHVTLEPPQTEDPAEKRERVKWNAITRRPLHVSNPWIKYRTKNLIWLPAEFRATCVAVNNETLVMGHGSGESTTIVFDTDRISDYLAENA